MTHIQGDYRAGNVRGADWLSKPKYSVSPLQAPGRSLKPLSDLSILTGVQWAYMELLGVPEVTLGLQGGIK